jgi:hypothetical protein
MHVGSIAILFLSVGVAFSVVQEAPLPKTLLEAKTAMLVNEGVHRKTFDALYRAMKEWGRFRIVQEAKEADVIVSISVSSGLDRKFQLLIAESNSSTTLGADETNDWITASRPAKKLVSNLRQRLK